MSIQADDIIGELFPHPKGLLIKHLNGLERQFTHIQDEVLILNQIRKDVFDGLAAIVVQH
jgi:hypothetical protein